MSIFLSQSVHNILATLYLPNNQRTGERTIFIPNNCQQAAQEHINREETLHDWLLRIVGIAGNIENFIIEENIALVGEVRNTNGELTYINLQSLVTLNGSIEDFYLGQNGIDAHYFRLDLDYNSNKIERRLFKEPLPHIHIIPKDEPRFPLSLTSAKTCIVDFLEFLYRNYKYDIWYAWARNEWKQQNLDIDALPFFNTIDNAFEKGQMALLCEKYSDKLLEIKKCLFKSKEETSQLLPTLPDIAQLLDYNSPA